MNHGYLLAWGVVKAEVPSSARGRGYRIYECGLDARSKEPKHWLAADGGPVVLLSKSSLKIYMKKAERLNRIWEADRK